MNPLINLSDFIFSQDDNIFNLKNKDKDSFKNIDLVEEIVNDDIINDQDESYRNTSPGGKANIILKLLLEKERLSNKILIIDQPEDSLDNRTITDWLVEILNKLKFSNQIVAITHNSNIVINGDAQNVIIPNRIDFNNIDYLADTFESNNEWSFYDKSKIIKETLFKNILSNLEGGQKILIKRMHKWETLIVERIDINEIKSKAMAKQQQD